MPLRPDDREWLANFLQDENNVRQFFSKVRGAYEENLRDIENSEKILQDRDLEAFISFQYKGKKLNINSAIALFVSLKRIINEASQHLDLLEMSFLENIQNRNQIRQLAGFIQKLDNKHSTAVEEFTRILETQNNNVKEITKREKLLDFLDRNYKDLAKDISFD